MELHFLGRGAAFYVEAGNTSAYLREGSRLLLLDCGESVFADLLRRDVLSGVTDIAVALRICTATTAVRSVRSAITASTCCTSSPSWFSRRTRPIARTS